MVPSRRLREKWIKNFHKSPLYNYQQNTFTQPLANQLFYGTKEEKSIYPSNFQSLYRNQSVNTTDAINTILTFLSFIGITLSKDIITTHIDADPSDLNKLVKTTASILRTIAHHHGTINAKDPFSDNYRDIEFLLRIETGQAQLSIFELDLPQLYARNVAIPDGYDSDPIIKDFFSRIEESNQSFFITGKAGTGKSTFINYFTQKTRKTVVLMAFTGLAAANIGGVTIHSFFRFPLRPLLPGDEDIKVFHEKDNKRKIIEELDTIIIDEVSMLRADVLQAIDYSLRQNGGDPSKPFGGKQLLFVGDLFQLPPVAKGDDVDQFLFTEIFNSPYFFDSDAYKELSPGCLQFTKSYRQKEDSGFVQLLDEIRQCDVDDTTLNIINKRFDPEYVPEPSEFSITLTTNNAIANAVNSRRLNDLKTTNYSFSAEVKGDFDDQHAPGSNVLELKKDAQVIFVKNDPTGERRWVNGTIGKIDFIAKDLIEVRLPNGSVYKLEKDTWEHRKYKYDRDKSKVVSEVRGTFMQYPVKLAWAITIHKSQGLTFDKVIIDLGSGAFVNGQLYTALSRSRTLNGIILRKRIQYNDIIQDSRLMTFYQETLS